MEHQEVMYMIWTISPSLFRHTLRNTEYPLSLHMAFLMQNKNIYILYYVLVLFMHEMLYVLF